MDPTSVRWHRELLSLPLGNGAKASGTALAGAGAMGVGAASLSSSPWAPLCVWMNIVSHKRKKWKFSQFFYPLNMLKLEINGHISHASIVRHPLQKWILSKVVPKMYLLVFECQLQREQQDGSRDAVLSGVFSWGLRCFPQIWNVLGMYHWAVRD